MYVGHDVGTGGDKAVLVDGHGRVLASATASYALDHPGPHRAEQAPADWWRAVIETTRAVIAEAGVSPDEVQAICFAGQMLALVAMDADGRPTRPAISWLDGRAHAQARRLVRRFGGDRIIARLAGGTPTGKDILPKIAWLREHEPEVYRRTRFFGDATSYLVARATGRVRIDPTAAGTTGVFDPGARRWSKALAWLTSLPLDMMPTVLASDEAVGGLTEEAAEALGLEAGTPVAMGMADIPAAAVGSGAVRPGEAHLYLGTSSWVGVTSSKPKSVARAGIASVPAADRSSCLLVGESETAGACRQWACRVLGVSQLELDELANEAAPGAEGLVFLPWLFGERTPVPDPHVRGGFVGLSLPHGRTHMARAVLEGVALNSRWTLDEMARVGERCPTLRVIGGGAESDVWLQIYADVTERPIERVAAPRLAGAVGAALMGAVAIGDLPRVASIAEHVRVDREFRPDPSKAALYAASYRMFRDAYPGLSRLGRPS